MCIPTLISDISAVCFAFAFAFGFDFGFPCSLQRVVLLQHSYSTGAMGVHFSLVVGSLGFERHIVEL